MLRWLGFLSRRPRALGPTLPQSPSPCFLCEPSAPVLEHERPGLWLVPRYACTTHKQAATLESGEPLASFLARRQRGQQLDGSGLNLLFNPITCGGNRAWVDFGFGGWAVMEEVFTSASYFDYWVQHRSECVSALYVMHSKGEVSQAASDVWSWFEAMWEHDQAIAREFQRRGHRGFDSPEEAVEFYHKSWAHVVGDSKGLTERLSALAASRFGHLVS